LLGTWLMVYWVGMYTKVDLVRFQSLQLATRVFGVC